ncbi:Type-1 restriction enzyme EcoKI specificity protein [Neolewinella maritima]|uniref:Type-1 restriction enzyme EcoKI specificity protein n=1 Tax=Neolewinella maritima TaxID=1383882 RepID=A0ABN8F8C7_9BACT|nr:restriction endonuclease subunit S [Neolewinella maritima]CAH1002257.1 Type-1 restriction enzyme EcoKI specificity protein [Neolewinella maritima]
MLGVRLDNLNELEVPLPPLPEQRAIVAKLERLFTELDRSVAELEVAREKLGVYRQSVLKEAFAGRLTEGWRERQHEPYLTPQPRNSSKFKADISSFDLTLPQQWQVEALGNLSNGVQYGTSAKSLKEGSIPVLRMGNMQNGRLDWSDLKYSVDQTEITKYKLSKGDVLFNRTNSPEWVGKTAIYNEEQPAIFAGYLIRINQDINFLDGQYLTYFLNSHTAKMHGNRVKTDGVNQSNINGKKLSSYPIPLPSLIEQHQVVQEIDSRFSVADHLEREIGVSLERARGLRQGVLKRAFAGELI